MYGVCIVYLSTISQCRDDDDRTPKLLFMSSGIRTNCELLRETTRGCTREVL